MMRRLLFFSLLFVLGLLMFNAGPAMTQQATTTATTPEWSFNATAIEACSCPMFCQCYFNTKPAAHGGHDEGEHFCRFNAGYKVNKGNYGNLKLDGVKFWLAGDLGGDFTKGMDWAELTFDPSVTKEQREAISTILGHLMPVKWNSFMAAKDAAIEWKATKDRAEARLNGGKIAEVVLNRNPGMTDEPVVIKNLRYWGAPRNDGFVLMPNEIQAYRVGNKPFEFKGTNGFMITVDMASKDIM
jgi:hypothetical protein